MRPTMCSGSWTCAGSACCSSICAPSSAWLAVEATNRTRIIVVDTSIEGQKSRVGLVADCVFAVTDLGGGALEPPPAIGSRWRADYIVGVGRHGAAFVIVLDLERLLGSDAPLIASAA